MSVTLDLNTLLLALVFAALIVLIIYLIVLVKKLLITVTHANKILRLYPKSLRSAARMSTTSSQTYQARFQTCQTL